MTTPQHSTSTSAAPSLFDGGEVGTNISIADLPARSQQRSLVDLLYDGFYLIFLLRSGYVPRNPEELRTQVVELLARFERQARRQDIRSDDIYDSKYAYVALLDETIMQQQSPEFAPTLNRWSLEPLQLTLFGSQLAGEQFFTKLEELRAQGAGRLPALEVFHYVLLLGFQGRYRLEAPEKINYLTGRLGDEVTFLRGRKREFAPFWGIPDQVRHALRGEMPLTVILALLLSFGALGYAGLRYLLTQETHRALAPFSHLIASPEQQASVTIYLP